MTPPGSCFCFCCPSIFVGWGKKGKKPISGAFWVRSGKKGKESHRVMSSCDNFRKQNLLDQYIRRLRKRFPPLLMNILKTINLRYICFVL